MASEDEDVERLAFSDDGRFPNSELPVLIYRGVVDPANATEAFKTLFNSNGWPAEWVDSVFTYHHYHSTAHEALGVASGSAELTLGGPEGETISVEPGDVVVIPAGVAHKLESSSDDFSVVGAYPDGQEWDVLTGEAGDRKVALPNIAAVPLPPADPVAGEHGPLIEYWHEG